MECAGHRVFSDKHKLFVVLTKLFWTLSSWEEESWSLSGAWVRLALRHRYAQKYLQLTQSTKEISGHPSSQMYPQVPSKYPKVNLKYPKVSQSTQKHHRLPWGTLKYPQVPPIVGIQDYPHLRSLFWLGEMCKIWIYWQYNFMELKIPLSFILGCPLIKE